MSFSFSFILVATAALLLLGVVIYLGIIVPYRRNRDALEEEFHNVHQLPLQEAESEEDRFVDMVVAVALFSETHVVDVPRKRKLTEATYFVTDNWAFLTGRPAPHVSGLYRRVRERVEDYRQFSKTDSNDNVGE